MDTLQKLQCYTAELDKEENAGELRIPRLRKINNNMVTVTNYT